jgi:hypothetical protein
MQTSACRSDDETERPSDDLHLPSLTYHDCGLEALVGLFIARAEERSLMDMTINAHSSSN